MTTKTKPTDTSKVNILTAAVQLAREEGLHMFSRIHVAKRAKVGESTVSYHFGTMPELRKAIVYHAVAHEIMPILADARAGREHLGVLMDAELRKKVGEFIAR